MKYWIISAAWLAIMLALIAASLFMDQDTDAQLYLWVIFILGQNKLDKIELLTEISDLRRELKNTKHGGQEK